MLGLIMLFGEDRYEMQYMKHQHLHTELSKSSLFLNVYTAYEHVIKYEDGFSCEKQGY